ncbi:PHP domain-containing protein [Paenibacillus sp. Marseille-Q4541]|uniref:PHP domain-containing protein n=1 Tax=Paenibacillus sp. Marseille-Q4541 TaxID=2831522 RepID=UPI001BA6B0C3|nr:PHP domain-containing protein [Paenibacillus sp. Marseille-Q4541]
MLIDLHTHGKLSKKSDFSLDYFDEMMREAKLNGVDAVALTEHFNTKNYEAMYEALDEAFPYNGHYYEANGVHVFPGIEVDIRETGHILLIGTKEEILTIRAELEPYTSKENFIPFADLLLLAQSYNVLKIGGHPFRDSTPLHHLNKEWLTQLDALDLNAKDLYKQGVEANRQKLEPFAAQLGLPIVAGSDTHQCLQYGSVVNRLAASVHTVEDLKQAIQNGSYQIEISDALDLKVKASVMLKKVLKQLKGEPPSREELEEERIGS